MWTTRAPAFCSGQHAHVPQSCDVDYRMPLLSLHLPCGFVSVQLSWLRTTGELEDRNAVAKKETC